MGGQKTVQSGEKMRRLRVWRKEKHFRLVGGHSGVKEPGVSGQCQIVPGGLSPRPHKQACRGRHGWKGGWLRPGRAVSISLRKSVLFCR